LVKKLDDIDLRRESLWIAEGEIRAARKQSEPRFSSRGGTRRPQFRRVAERQLPKPWTMEVEPGVKIGQLVRADRGHWLLHPADVLRWFPPW